MAFFRSILILFTLVVTIVGCKKQDPTSWDTGLALPIAFGKLDITDLLADSLLLEHPDGSLSLIYDQEVLNIRIDSLLEIPSDTVINSWSLPVSLNVPANTLIFTQSDEFELSNSTASLTSATLRDGELELLITNEIEAEIIVEYEIPEASLNGEALIVEIFVPPSSNGTPGSVSQLIDIGGYALNLTGQNGNAFNTLSTLTRIKTADNGQITSVSANDNVVLSVVYKSLGVSAAVGYFNTTQADFEGVESTFDEFSGIYESVLSLESASARLTFTNGFGADLRAFVNQLRITNSYSEVILNLENSIVGTPINLSRAIRMGNVLFPSEKTFLLNPDNSNITSFIEVLGDSLIFTGSAELNPLGNISNYNDFILDQSRLKAEISLEIPLNFSITNLVLRDSIALNWDDTEVFPSEMELFMKFENQFPISMDIAIVAIDRTGNTLLNLNEYLVSGSSVIGGSSELIPESGITLFKFDLGPSEVDAFKMASKLVVTAQTETTDFPDTVQIRAGQGIDVQVSTKATVRIE